MNWKTINVDKDFLTEILLWRNEDSHKGDYGHALLICGCERMPGAAVLATGAALHSGCGLVTLHSTRTACQAAINSFPSAMLSPEDGEYIGSIPEDISRYDAIGCGPGLGKEEPTVAALERLLDEARAEGKHLVLDADALNIISLTPGLIGKIPVQSVLTPHMGELRRLLGTDSPTGEMVKKLCLRTGCAIVVKGPRTHIYSPTGEIFINTSGNAGLAKGGSGDVLTGLITGLMARAYLWYEAAVLGVWLHGYAGDCLTAEKTAEAYDSSELIGRIYKGFVSLYGGENE